MKLQQMSRGQLQVEERHQERLDASLQDYEASLLHELFQRNDRKDSISRATPPGYHYVRADLISSPLADPAGAIMQIAAHPGDGPDFFYATYLQMASNTAYRSDYYEVLLTNGEWGVDGWQPERTRQARIKEAYAGAALVGSRPYFLGYPDGGLSTLTESQREQLVEGLARLILSIQPALLIVHPPKHDHPDHAHSFLLALAALELNAQRQGRRPALYIHDVEFGLQQKSLWRLQTAEPHLSFYPLHSPDFLVDISSTHQVAQNALFQHKTQMIDPGSGQPKLYADLVDILAQVRGLQFLTREMPLLPQGQGFSQVIIADLTEEQDTLLLRLPTGKVYRRGKEKMEQA